MCELREPYLSIKLNSLIPNSIHSLSLLSSESHAMGSQIKKI